MHVPGHVNPLTESRTFDGYRPIALSDRYQIAFVKLAAQFPTRIDVDLEYYDLAGSVRYLTRFTGEDDVTTKILEEPNILRTCGRFVAYLQKKLDQTPH